MPAGRRLAYPAFPRHGLAAVRTLRVQCIANGEKRTVILDVELPEAT
jgi:hypothetical protein